MIENAKLDLTRHLEQSLLNVWPALTTEMRQGWVIRMANGYSSRANSASALVPGASLSPDLLKVITRRFDEAGLAPRFRLTPLAAPGIEDLLITQGFRLKDVADTMTVELEDHIQRDPRIVLSNAADPVWVSGISSRQEPSKRQPDHLLAIVNRIRLPAAFATLMQGDTPTGFGLCVVDGDWAEIGSVMIDEKSRNKGLGQALVRSLMAWASSIGARNAFLQVDIENAPAVALYQHIGFRPLYRYRTLIRA